MHGDTPVFRKRLIIGETCVMRARAQLRERETINIDARSAMSDYRRTTFSRLLFRRAVFPSKTAARDVRLININARNQRTRISKKKPEYRNARRRSPAVVSFYAPVEYLRAARTFV